LRQSFASGYQIASFGCKPAEVRQDQGLPTPIAMTTKVGKCHHAGPPLGLEVSQVVRHNAQRDQRRGNLPRVSRLPQYSNALLGEGARGGMVAKLMVNVGTRIQRMANHFLIADRPSGLQALLRVPKRSWQIGLHACDQHETLKAACDPP